MTAQILDGRLSHEEYLAIEKDSFSSLKPILDSPRAYYRNRLQPKKETDPMRVGSAGHMAVFEPDRFEHQCATWTGKVRNGRAWDAFKEEHAGCIILTQAQHDNCRHMRDAVRSHPVAKLLLEQEGRAEVPVTWTCRGLQLKGRLDWLARELVDLKTTRNPRAREFLADAYRQKYHMQLAMYADAVAIALQRAPLPYIIAAQNTEPFEVACYVLDDHVLSHGRMLYERAVDLALHHKQSGQWPGIADDGPLAFELPRWAEDYQPSSDSDICF